MPIRDSSNTNCCRSRAVTDVSGFDSNSYAYSIAPYRRQASPCYGSNRWWCADSRRAIFN